MRSGIATLLAKRPRLVFLGFLAIGAALGSCSDACRKYSDFTCSEIEKANYNTYFYYPDQTEMYLGESSGLAACGAAARGYAVNHGMSDADWGYVCCMIAQGSSCYEK